MFQETRRRLFGRIGAALFGLAALAALPAAAGAETTVDDIISRGKLVVAIDTTTPPYGMLDSQMQPSGFDIELAQLIGKAIGVPVEFVTVTSPGRIPALLDNRVDMVVSIFSITAQRALQVSFSIPYASQSSVVLAPKSTNIKSAQDLVGLKVGVTRGTGEDGLLTAAAQETPGINILRFDDYASIAQAMLSGQIDAMGGGDYGDIYLKKSAKGDD
ncbi:MAG: transporter substrate-binding domain-containing protein, partial [Rhizobiales bacterium]|nr:transporter substrate-binding domain-containing protein [Hyphomicrobiales bacterium]